MPENSKKNLNVEREKTVTEQKSREKIKAEIVKEEIVQNEISHKASDKELSACIVQHEVSHKEERIRKITNLYYSRKDVQEAMFEFSKNREISPRYFEGFGKRPDAFQYPGDIFSLVKKGATSFHCSEEIWEDPLEITTEMTVDKYNELRIGWDLLIDIDCPWIEGSKYAAIAIINVLKKHGITSISVKFSGSKGFHILVPFKTFPKEIAGEDTKNLFPSLPRKLVAYLRFEAGKELEKTIPDDFLKSILKNTSVKRGIKCNRCGEIAREYEVVRFFCPSCKRREEKKLDVGADKKVKCPECKNTFFVVENSFPHYVCEKCKINSRENSANFSRAEKADLFEVMGLDLVLVSPRHLFRMPYSLHEKTALASVVLESEDLEKFDLTDADPMKIKIKNFMPTVVEGESKEFVTKALDWYSENAPREEEKITGKYADFKPIVLKNIEDSEFPPCIKKILNGMGDGRKRALFALINIFRSVGMNQEDMEKKIYSWNEKNSPPLKKGYIDSQLQWAYKKKPIMPPNCREFYSNLGVCVQDNTCPTIKNPVNYVIKKNFIKNKNKK